jgi:hypothetical protein
MTAVLWPNNARPDEKLALEVVLPTPPLPEVTTIIFATENSLSAEALITLIQEFFTLTFLWKVFIYLI